jgi:hypothetical protein
VTKREHELAKRHLSELVDMRDEQWIKVLENTEGETNLLIRHKALVHAVKLAEAALR